MACPQAYSNINSVMKMYCFSKGVPYGEEYHVMAKSKNEALVYLQRYLSEKESELSPYSILVNHYDSEYEFFKQHTELIREYGEGEVIQTS